MKLLKTLGKELNQNKLKAMVNKLNISEEEEMFEEIYKRWRNNTLDYIMSDVLGSANDFYMDEAFDKEDIIDINNLLADLRRD